MNIRINTKQLFLCPALAFVVILPVPSLAQNFNTLYSFPGPEIPNPFSILAQAGNTLYGVTGQSVSCPGDNGCQESTATVFAINTDGTGFTPLYSFSGLPNPSEPIPPAAGLVLSENTIYGTTFGAALTTFGGGSVFSLNTDSTGFATLHSFSSYTSCYPCVTPDGATPSCGVILSGNTLYGTAGSGGESGNGTLFAINADGTSFSVLHSFGPNSSSYPGTNIDGGWPRGQLTLSGNTLYGTASQGGIVGGGTLYSVNTDGTGFTVLHNFDDFDGKDGDTPLGELILSGNTLYGTTFFGGTEFSGGMVFAVNTNGTDFKMLHSFPTRNGGAPVTNSDGSNPEAGLVLIGHTLYGTTLSGGSGGWGVVFAVNTDGSGFTVLHAFAGPDGLSPGALFLSGTTLYGTTWGGGQYSYGALFSLDVPPQVTLSRSGADVILTWPTNFTGYSLQATTNLTLAAGWTGVSPDPTLVNGWNTVTNPMTGPRQFYRLAK